MIVLLRDNDKLHNIVCKSEILERIIMSLYESKVENLINIF